MEMASDHASSGVTDDVFVRLVDAYGDSNITSGIALDHGLSYIKTIYVATSSFGIPGNLLVIFVIGKIV